MSTIYSDDKGQFEYQSVGMTNSFELFLLRKVLKPKKSKIKYQIRFFWNPLSKFRQR